MSLLQIHEPGQTPEPHAEDEAAGVAIGIDLGTTHSVVAASCEGRPVALGMPGDFIIPSIVSYLDGSAVVGNVAKDAPDAIHSIKRKMDRAAEKVATSQGDKTPIEISADILKACKIHAEAILDADIKKAVITVPAYFDDAARTATRDAARLAGLEVLRLINEPTAAALAYGLDSQAEGIYAIYDFGGGTFDMSILRLSQGVFQVLATGGDTQLGGDDVDAVIAEHCNVNQQEARRMKEALSEQNSVKAKSSEAELTRDQLASLASPLINRTLTISESVLHDAQMDVSDINGVVLVGGSTRMPLVRAAVKGFFKQQPFSDLDPDQLVALGAALQAEALTVGSENLLLDVTPLSLGLETMGGLVEKVIHRNTPIPVSKAQEFTTYQDGQTAMKITVVQGEREMVADCRQLAEFTLTDIPPMAANVARIKVMFTVDADGLLTVSASEETTGKQARVEVKPTYGLSVDDMEQMLRASMENAQTDITQRLLAEARVEAERLIHDLTSALSKDVDVLSEDEQAEINAQLGALRGAIAGDDREIIDAQTMALDAVCQTFAQKRMDKAIGSALKGQSIETL